MKVRRRKGMNNLISRIDKDELAARAVFLGNVNRPLDFDGIKPDCKDHVHVVVIGADRRMLFMLQPCWHTISTLMTSQGLTGLFLLLLTPQPRIWMTLLH